MIVTETLARGLHADLYRVIEDEVRRQMRMVTEEQLIREMGRLDSRKAVHRLHSALRQQHTQLLLSCDRLEAKRSMAWLITLAIHADAVIRETPESGLSFHFLGFRLRPWEFEDLFLSPWVGEHAIRRIYQRYGNQQHTIPTVRNILPELKFAAIFGNWIYSAMRTGCHDDLPAFVPSMAGAFLGSASKVGKGLELRTYISREQMRPDQIALWKQLLELWRAYNLERLLPLSLLLPGKFNDQISNCMVRIRALIQQHKNNLRVETAKSLQ